MIQRKLLSSIIDKKSFFGSKKGTILVVDDDIAMRTILTTVLSKEFTVITKKNGLEALVWLSEGNLPDVILSDIMMPYINGYDFVRNLRQSGVHSAIPILVLSGHDVENTEDDILKTGADAYFSKPFDPRIILDAVLKAYLRASMKGKLSLQHN